MILDPTSLMKTVDNINEMFLWGKEISPEQGFETASWIITQQGKNGSYRGMFAPTPTDFEQGMHLFTGERLVSASARHILGQEAARAAWLLGKDDPVVRETYHQVTGWMRENQEFRDTGTFCCGRCTLAFWRHFWVGDFEKKVDRLSNGLEMMKDHRSGDGRWHRFPFFYSIYTLSQIDLEPARSELRYASPILEKYVKSNKGPGVYALRRAHIIQQALERIN